MPGWNVWLSRVMALLSLLAAGVGLAIVKTAPVPAALMFALAGLFLVLPLPGLASNLGGFLPVRAAPVARWEWIFIGILLVITALPRFWGLNEYPPGAHGHEGEMVSEVIENLDQGRYRAHVDDDNILWPSLIFYQGLGAAKIFGWQPSSFRMPAGLWGVLSVLAFYFCLRGIAGAGAAALAAILFASCQLHLAMSRTFFPGSILFFAPLAGFGLLLAALRNRKRSWFFAAGVAAALGMHAYVPGRVLGLLFVIWFAWLAVFDHHRRASLKQFGLFMTGWVLMASPVLWYALLERPEVYWHYVNQANPVKSGGAAAVLENFFVQLPSYLKLFHVHGSIAGAWDVPRSAMLDSYAGLVVPVGFAVALVGLWRPVYAFFLGLLLAGLAPAILGGGFMHPTIRRVVMALPAVFALAAIGLDRFSKRANPTGHPGMNAALLGCGLALALLAWRGAVYHYFVDFSSHPGVLVEKAMPQHYAGQEMREWPHDKASVSPMVKWSVTLAMLWPRDKATFEVRSVERLLALEEGADHLLLLEPVYRRALPFLTGVYPHSQVRLYPVSGDVDSRDPSDPDLHLVRLRVPAADVKALSDLLFENGKPAKIYDGEFSAWYKGKKLRLNGALVMERQGGKVKFELPWSGWRLEISGKPVKFGQEVQVDGGLLDLRLSGQIPNDALGPLPLSFSPKKGEQHEARRIVALEGNQGLKMSYRPGKDNFEGRPAFVRYEALPVKRFFDPSELPMPFSVTAQGRLEVVHTGRYQLKLDGPAADGRIFVNGVKVFERHDVTVPALVTAVSLRAGEPAQLRVEFNSRVEGQERRVFSLVVDRDGGGFVPLPRSWLRPVR